MKQNSNFVHRKNISNQPLAGLSDSDDLTEGTLYEGMPIYLAVPVGIGVWAIGSALTVWVGSKVLGYNH